MQLRSSHRVSTLPVNWLNHHGEGSHPRGQNPRNACSKKRGSMHGLRKDFPGRGLAAQYAIRDVHAY